MSDITPLKDAEEIIRLLGLEPHPEGGFFRETFRDSCCHDGRSQSSLIYFLLRGAEISAWHRIDAVEAWHHYAGAPLRLSIWKAGAKLETIELGPDLRAGQQPQAVVAANFWQMGECLGGMDEWTLVGCSVAPAFEFSRFEMAPSGWTPDENAR